jgi:lipopolysaccharide export LptBFGC system permease protein LptF
MKTLDKYIVRNFLIGYVIAFCVLIGLRIIIDLFVNLDEFTEHADLGVLAVVKNMFTFYGLNTTLYFRDFAGMITVVAAAFSFGKMVRSNEFVAMMASGVSLKRVIAPVVLLAVLLTGLLVMDQELIIPLLGDKLVRDQDYVAGQEFYDVRFINDARGSLIFSRRFDAGTATFYWPTILIRRKVTGPRIWEVTGWISAKEAVYNSDTQQWDLTNGRFSEKGSSRPPQPIDSYTSDIKPQEIPVRCKAEHKALLSWSQLATLQRLGPQKDLAQLYSQKHFRVTDPIINLIMLMVCLPILVCRDPKVMKNAVTVSFAVVGSCMVTNFVCRILAPEAIFGSVIPGFWAWLPVFIFLPTAFIEWDSMKT